jgi:putative Holliday junction resolvase
VADRGDPALGPDLTAVGRIAGIDYGERRIGLALSDPLGSMAQPWETFPNRGAKTFLPLIEKLRGKEVTEIVVGLPKHMNNDEGEKARQARAFGETLAAQSGLPVHFVDERLTTSAAQRSLQDSNLSGPKKRAVVDQIAAALILQIWMDQQKNQRNK